MHGKAATTRTFEVYSLSPLFPLRARKRLLGQHPLTAARASFTSTAHSSAPLTNPT